MSFHHSWPEPLVDKLKVLWAVHSAGEVAKILNEDHGLKLTRNAVIGKLRRLGLSIDDKSKVHPLTSEKNHKKKTAPTGMSIGSFAYGIIHRIKAKQNGSAAPVRELPRFTKLADVVPLHLSLEELTSKTCRWPYGEAAPFTFCGCEKIDGGPYCHAHDDLSKPDPQYRKSVKRAA